MSFRRLLRPFVVALFGAVTTALASYAQQPTVIPTGNWPVAIYSADVNEDGKPDLIYIAYGATPSTSSTHILLNNGDGTFRAGVTLATAGSVLAIGHFDSSPAHADPTHTTPDQHVDIGWLNVSGNSLTALFAYGNGDGAFTGPIIGNITQVTPNPPNIVSMVAAPYVTGQADFLFAVDAANGPVVDAFYRLSFYSRPIAVSGAARIQPSELNADGLMDYVVTSPGASVSVFLGTPPATTPPTFPAHAATYGSNVFASSLADIDGDRHPDLITEGGNGRLDIYHGNADGTFSTISEIGTGASDGTTGNGGHIIAITDLNGDGILDIVTATPAGISVLLGQGGLNYKLLGIYNAGPGRGSYTLADFNSDGHLDLAVDSPEGIAILYGNADGSFQSSRSFAVGLPADGLALGQFTASGKVDAVVANGTPVLLEGDGTGLFTPSPTPFVDPKNIDLGDSGWWSVQAGDFDHDGHLDAAFLETGQAPPFAHPVVAGPAPAGGAQTYIPFFPLVELGNGAGAFPTSKFFNVYPTQGTSTVGDLDGDGASDLVSFNSDGCTIYWGSGAAQLVVGADPGSGPYNTGAVGFLKAGRSNKQDLVYQNSTSLQVFRNNGDSTFTLTATLTPPSTFATPSANGIFPATGLFPSTVLLSDLDGDGNADVIVLYHNLASDPAHPNAATPNQLVIYWGNGDGTFTAPLIQSTTRNYTQAAVADGELILSDGYLISVLPQGKGLPRTFGTEIHELAGMGINGVATTTLNGYTSLIVANGGAVLSTPAINRGTLASNAEVNTGGITVLLNGPGTATTTNLTGTLTATPTNPGYGRTFTLTATLNPIGPPPTGTVAFSIDGNLVNTATIAGNVATYAVTTPTYAVGSHTLTAVYSGDANYNTLTLTGTLTVTLLPTTTMMTNVVTPIYYGQIIGDIAIGSTQSADPQPGDQQSLVGGSLVFFISGTQVCSLPVNGTSQKCPPTTGAGYSVGNYTISAMYTGNAFYASSTSPDYPVQILADITSPSTLTSSLNPATAGQPVKFTAVFTAPFATPTGTVTFLDGSTAIGTGILDATGTATLTVSTLAVGSHPITATYAATTNFTAATTSVLDQVIIPAPVGTTTMLASSVNPSTVGQSVTFTAAVAAVSASAIPLAGTVTFTVDSVNVGTVTLNTQGTASFTTTTLTLGSHNVIANYTGTSGSTSAPQPFTPSTSPTLVQVVNQAPATPGFTLTVTPAAISVPIGNTTSVLITVTALNGFNQPVALSCGSLPREVTCAFAANTITGSGTTFLAVSAAAPHTCGTDAPYFITPASTTWLGLLSTIGLMLMLRRRRLLQGLTLALALWILPTLTGCGHCTDLGVEPGNYSFTVTGTTAGSVNETVTQTIKMVAHL